MGAEGQRRPVLVVIVEYGEFPEMLRLADVVSSRLGRPVKLFFAKRAYRDLPRDSAMAVARGHAWMDSSGHEHEIAAPAERATAEAPGAEPVRRRPGTLRAWIGDVRGVVRDYRGFRRRYREIESVLWSVRPALVVVGQDLLGKELSFALIAARRLGIPTLIVPFAMFSIRELAEYALARTEHQIDGRPLNRLLAKRYPRWVRDHEGRRLVRLPGSRGLALEWAGLVDGDPWAPCSEPASALACESRIAQRGFVAMGIPAERMRITGSPVHDRLAAALGKALKGREAFMARHGLDNAQPLVVCGWPANIFAWLGGRAIAYPDYESLAQAWARILARMKERHRVEVLVSVHPKTLASELQALRRHGLAFARGESEAAVACCDVFVTLNGSSITAWAIACSKPVLLFDCYRTGYRDFDGAPGCVRVEEEAAFQRELERLCAEPDRRRALASAQAAVAGDWAELDGRAEERLAALCAELIGTR